MGQIWTRFLGEIDPCILCRSPRYSVLRGTERSLMTSGSHRLASTRELQLKEQFGELLSTTDLARVLRYRTTQAVRKARLRGALRIPMQQLPGRRGWFATARAVAAYLDGLDPPDAHIGG